jgi:hypothetical protein
LVTDSARQAVSMSFVPVFLTLREEHVLRVFENRVLRDIWTLGGESNRRMGKLQNEELHKFYSSPNIVKVTKSRCL